MTMFRLRKVPKLAQLAALPPSPEATRMEFACRLVRALVDTNKQIAVIDDAGKAAMVYRHERLFDVLAQDHAIVGVYKFGVRVPEVVDDLKAAGL